jgi:predicted DNA-binding protein with PD1-like motif
MDGQTLQGGLWKAKKIDSTYIVSLNDKVSMVEALTDFVKQTHITTGSITGLGAVNEATLLFFDPMTKKYVDKTFHEQMEASNITGNISVKDGEPFLHLHITLGRRDYTALAGHLQDGTIRGAGEFYITAYTGTVNRKFSDELGLNYYDF